ncbi:MAG TPA: type VI secretion system protein TssA [Chthoniobacter sp.]|jgi:type VI secretion system protein ImpA
MDIEPLLQPISPEAPCGEDLSYDASFNELETLAKGKEAQQFSGSENPEWQVAAEEPDWNAVQTKAVELFGRSKDLRVTMILILALLKMEGLPGLRDGLSLLQRLIREQWDGVYPRLDPDDNSDPTERINIVAGLGKPLATFGDPMRFIERIRQTSLCNSVQMGRFSLADVTQLGLPAGSTATPPTPAQVDAAFRDTNPDELAVISEAVKASRATVEDVDNVLMELVGAGNAPNLDELTGVLGEIKSTLAPYLPQDPSEISESPQADANAGAGAAGASSGGGGAFTGVIKGRADVSRAIDQICDYYRTAEPGNPVPLLLRRAQRLVDLDFMAMMEDLMPESIGQLGNIIGTKRQGESAPPAEPPPSE